MFHTFWKWCKTEKSVIYSPCHLSFHVSSQCRKNKIQLIQLCKAFLVKTLDPAYSVSHVYPELLERTLETGSFPNLTMTYNGTQQKHTPGAQVHSRYSSLILDFLQVLFLFIYAMLQHVGWNLPHHVHYQWDEVCSLKTIALDDIGVIVIIPGCKAFRGDSTMQRLSISGISVDLPESRMATLSCWTFDLNFPDDL